MFGNPTTIGQQRCAVSCVDGRSSRPRAVTTRRVAARRQSQNRNKSNWKLHWLSVNWLVLVSYVAFVNFCFVLSHNCFLYVFVATNMIQLDCSFEFVANFVQTQCCVYGVPDEEKQTLLQVIGADAILYGFKDKFRVQ